MEPEANAAAPPGAQQRWEERNRRFGQLLAAARTGGPAAFEELYDASARWLLSVVRRLVDDGQAEDVLAEVFLQVWKSLESYDPGRAPPCVWLAMIARSRALDHLRRERRNVGDDACPADHRESHGDPADAPDEILTRAQHSRLLQLSVANLDRVEQLVIALAYFQSCTHSEISRKTGLSLGNVKASMARAQYKLRRSLGASDGGAAAGANP